MNVVWQGVRFETGISPVETLPGNWRAYEILQGFDYFSQDWTATWISEKLLKGKLESDGYPELEILAKQSDEVPL